MMAEENINKIYIYISTIFEKLVRGGDCERFPLKFKPFPR